MTQDKFKRKLTTILSADVAGYSRLMGENEAATVKTLENYKQVIAELIRQQRGRVVDSPGDNLLAEFTSVVDAVQCAVATQKELQARNEELPENRKMQFRMGINLGDVIEEESRIYGDGVNIAARLESLADPGGICVSKTAFDQIEMKLPLGYEFLGEQMVKNIARPVGAYKVLMEPRVVVTGAKRPTLPLWQRNGARAGLCAVLALIVGLAVWNFYFRPPSMRENALPLPGKPSIAVLPFTNLSDVKDKEYFSDGLAEEIINALAKLPQLFVIARNSSFFYKGKAIDARQIGRELGVKYLLEGSIRQENNRVRITAQLVDGSTGNHVFSEKYDRDLKEIFATQDEITLKILKAFQLNLTEGDQALVYARGTDNLEAYLKLLQATEYVRRQNPNDNEKAKRILEDAIAIDPNYPMPYRMLGALYMMEAWLGSATSPRDSLQKGAELLQRTIVLDPTMGSAYAVLGNINILLRDFERGIELGQKAVELEPNGADSHAYLGLGFLLVGRLEDALKTFKNAIRLNPDAPAWYLHNLAAAYSYSGFYDEAIEWAKKAINRHPNNIFAHMVLAANYIQVGRDVEARAEAEQVLRINPSFSLERFAKINPFKSQEMHKRYIDALSKAGLK